MWIGLNLQRIHVMRKILNLTRMEILYPNTHPAGKSDGMTFEHIWISLIKRF
jgi:hypothetical protein